MPGKNKKNIIFCITGAGQFLEDTYKFIKKLKKQGKHDVTLCFSAAGYEVVCTYGLEKIKNYARTVILEKNHGKSAPFCGKLNKKNYDFIVVAPATANTVSKIVYGIADTLVTNIIAQAGKNNIPVFILPTDAEKFQKTKIPNGKIIEIQCRELDIENAGKLEKIEGIKVIENLGEIEIGV